MSGLYNPNFSPARAASPQIRSNPEVDRWVGFSFLWCSFLRSKLKNKKQRHNLGLLVKHPLDLALSVWFVLDEFVCFWFIEEKGVFFFFFCSQYLSELLAEHQKLGPFMQVLPICSRLLNQGLALPVCGSLSRLVFALLLFMEACLVCVCGRSCYKAFLLYFLGISFVCVDAHSTTML